MLIFALISLSVLHCVLARSEQLPVVLVHGVARDISNIEIAAELRGVKLAARVGYQALQTNGGNVLDAVEKAVRVMEDDEKFNAGYGSALTWDGGVETDASIMNGADLKAGCVSIVKNILHPLSLARHVMEHCRHTYMAGEGVMRFAENEGFEILADGSLVTQDALDALENYKNSTEAGEISQNFAELGGVGAVAIDVDGNLAAAASNGGPIGKLPGRIGDSSILGGGIYADNSVGAISSSGYGGIIMRYNLASRIMHLIELEGMSAQQAAEYALEHMTGLYNETAGVVSIDVRGSLGIYFTSERMAWAYQRGNELHFGIDKDDDYFEIIEVPT